MVTGVQIHNWGAKFDDPSPNLEYVAPTRCGAFRHERKAMLQAAPPPWLHGSACRLQHDPAREVVPCWSHLLTLQSSAVPIKVSSEFYHPLPTCSVYVVVNGEKTYLDLHSMPVSLSCLLVVASFGGEGVGSCGPALPAGEPRVGLVVLVFLAWDLRLPAWQLLRLLFEERCARLTLLLHPAAHPSPFLCSPRRSR